MADCLPACLPACLTDCLPACLTDCLCFVWFVCFASGVQENTDEATAGLLLADVAGKRLGVQPQTARESRSFGSDVRNTGRT